ncbi:MAG: DUF4271 domain-containing protein [Bacteroidales bacterium]|nr:DUF4271 domain-containing protein [Bacteroidales bacterium]
MTQTDYYQDEYQVYSDHDHCQVYSDFDHCQVYAESDDSLWLSMPDPVPTQTFITEIRSQPTAIIPQLIIQPGFIWQFMALLLAAFIFAHIKVVRKNFFKNMIAAFSSRPLFKQLIRDDLLFPIGTQFLLFIAISLTFAVFLIQLDEMFVSSRFLTRGEELKKLALYLAGVIIVLSLKYLIHYFTGLIFKTRFLTKEYLTNSFYFNTLAAAIFIPLLMVSTFSKSEPVLIVVIGMSLILIALRMLRGFIISLGIEMYSYFQNLLYFCTLEILPFLVIYKVIIRGII